MSTNDPQEHLNAPPGGAVLPLLRNSDSCKRVATLRLLMTFCYIIKFSAYLGVFLGDFVGGEVGEKMERKRLSAVWISSAILNFTNLECLLSCIFVIWEINKQ